MRQKWYKKYNTYSKRWYKNCSN